ncbi:MAG: 50S ribosomal protein L10 [Minisyncoccota bacterium]
MAISKDKKREIVAKLTDAFKEASAVAFVGFSKLTVKDAAQMRKEFSRAGVRYFVAKKTLIRRALEGRGYKGDVPALPGEVAIAWTNGEEIIAPARGVHEYGKKLKGALALLGGVFEGAFLDAEKMTAIATIPPLPVLRGMFVNVINSPIQGLVIALDKISKQRSEATIAN